MITRRLDQLRDAVRHAADIVAFTDKHPNSQIDDLINRGLGALHRLTATVDPAFRPLGSVTITTDGDATTYGLPVDCRSIISCEYTADGSKAWMQPYEMHERAQMSAPSPSPGYARGYMVIGSNIELLPLPAAGHTVTIWYARSAPQLNADAEVVDVFDRLDDFVIWYAAREIAEEREAWERADRLGAKMAALEGEIRILARARDLSAAPRIVDLAVRDRFGRRIR